MEPIRVKIEKSSLKEPTTKSAVPTPPKNKSRFNKAKKVFFWLLVLILLLETAILSYRYLNRPSYTSLIAPNAVITVNFNKALLSEAVISLKNSQFAWKLFTLAADDLDWLLTKTNINLVEISQLFENQMALAVLPELINSSPQWLFLATIKTDSIALQSALEKIEKNLKQNFNFVSQDYRQIRLAEIKPLSQNSPGVFYSLIKKTFILSNSEAAIKNAINKKLP